jgi:hypothetical protein
LILLAEADARSRGRERALGLIKERTEVLSGAAGTDDALGVEIRKSHRARPSQGAVAEIYNMQETNAGR